MKTVITTRTLIVMMDDDAVAARVERFRRDGAEPAGGARDERDRV